MDERNLINGSLVSYLSWAADFISPIRWFLLAAFALVLADLKFGIEAARHKGETIRKSRAIRRSANKIIDYLCWTGRHELWRSVRHTVRDSHITGSRAVSGVWLWNQFVFQQLLRSPGKQTANQYLQMVKKQVRYYGSLRRWKRYHENINFTSG